MVGIVWNWIIDSISFTGWLIIFGVLGLVAFYFLHPILIPIWRMMPTPLKVALGAAGAALLAWLGGRHVGRENAREEERRRNAEALQKRTEVERDTASKSDSDVRKELRDRWSRD